jgi:hypothetical protein
MYSLVKLPDAILSLSGCNERNTGELYDVIPDVTVWRVLRKSLHLQAYKLFIVQGIER